MNNKEPIIIVFTIVIYALVFIEVNNFYPIFSQGLKSITKSTGRSIRVVREVVNAEDKNSAAPVIKLSEPVSSERTGGRELFTIINGPSHDFQSGSIFHSPLPDPQELRTLGARRVAFDDEDYNEYGVRFHDQELKIQQKSPLELPVEKKPIYVILYHKNVTEENRTEIAITNQNAPSSIVSDGFRNGDKESVETTTDSFRGEPMSGEETTEIVDSRKKMGDILSVKTEKNDDENGDINKKDAVAAADAPSSTKK